MGIFADSGTQVVRIKLVKAEEALLSPIALFFCLLGDVETVNADFVFLFVIFLMALSTCVS